MEHHYLTTAEICYLKKWTSTREGNTFNSNSNQTTQCINLIKTLKSIKIPYLASGLSDVKDIHSNSYIASSWFAAEFSSEYSPPIICLCVCSRSTESQTTDRKDQELTIDFEELLQHFLQVQNKHRDTRRRNAGYCSTVVK